VPGRASLTDGFGQISDHEVWLHNVHIPEYTQGTWTNHEPRRTRKLLMHRREIDKLASETTERGLTLVPLALYFMDGKAKVELALARGKRSYDKRHDLRGAGRGQGGGTCLPAAKVAERQAMASNRKRARTRHGPPPRPLSPSSAVAAQGRGENAPQNGHVGMDLGKTRGAYR
jgi:SsrA-binding protein